MRLDTVATHSCTQAIRSRSFADSFCVVRINSNERAFPWVLARTWTKSEWVIFLSSIRIAKINSRVMIIKHRARTPKILHNYTCIYCCAPNCLWPIQRMVWMVWGSCCSIAVSVCKQNFCLLMLSSQCTCTHTYDVQWTPDDSNGRCLSEMWIVGFCSFATCSFISSPQHRSIIFFLFLETDIMRVSMVVHSGIMMMMMRPQRSSNNDQNKWVINKEQREREREKTKIKYNERTINTRK